MTSTRGKPPWQLLPAAAAPVADHAATLEPPEGATTLNPPEGAPTLDP